MKLLVVMRFFSRFTFLTFELYKYIFHLGVQNELFWKTTMEPIIDLNQYQRCKSNNVPLKHMWFSLWCYALDHGTWHMCEVNFILHFNAKYMCMQWRSCLRSLLLVTIDELWCKWTKKAFGSWCNWNTSLRNI
jgi:hypothetical protein